MEHPVFGRIEWDAGTGQWRGRVQLDYFSEYDTIAATTWAERLGVAHRHEAPDNRHQLGDFELRLISRDGGEPSPGQENAFLHFLDDSPDGLQYGITSGSDNPSTGNAAVTGANALIQNSVVFTFSGATGLTAAELLFRLFAPGGFHQDPAHRLGGGGK
jgi:hypothetical protein